MGNTAYSLNGSIWVPFPVGPRFGLSPTIEEMDLFLTTERGVRWTRRQFRRDKWIVPFRFTETQKAEFEDWHLTVDGQIVPFYFTLDYLAVSLQSIRVTKEAGFAPVMLQQPADEPVYDYVATLTGFVDPLTVLA